MAIPRITPRKQALLDRARRRRLQREWKHNPDNPDMVVCTRLLMSNGLGGYDKVEIELKPAEMTEIAAESLSYAETDVSKPNYQHDPLYSAAKRLRRRRLKERP